MEQRELTRQERAAIRSLVVRWCANYDREYGCLPLDCECYMLGKCYTGPMCRYFRAAVLPMDPELEASFLPQGPSTKPCQVCGRPIPRRDKRRYCSPACAKAAHRKQQRSHMRKKRGWAVDK